MKIHKKISFETLNAATAVLSQYVPGLSANDLLKAIESYNMDSEAAASKQNTRPQKPYTREEAAEMLGLSIPTIDRYMAQGKLHRIRYSTHSVRITPESVHKLMEGGAA